MIGLYDGFIHQRLTNKGDTSTGLLFLQWPTNMSEYVFQSLEQTFPIFSHEKMCITYIIIEK